MDILAYFEDYRENQNLNHDRNYERHDFPVKFCPECNRLWEIDKHYSFKHLDKAIYLPEWFPNNNCKHEVCDGCKSEIS